MPRKRGRPRRSNIGEENQNNISEDYCFECKDGGDLILCDFNNCNKSYHLECVGKDPTLPETEERWTCSWHTCFICKKSSKYRCHCCTNAVCKPCLKVANFVHVSGEKGFCNNCLKLALLVEENLDVDSDGGKVDFEDRDTFEFLFKDYWELLKVKEGLTLEILRKADIKLKKAEKYSNKFLEDEEDKDFSDDMDGKMEDQYPFMNESGLSSMKKGRRKTKKTEFIGWGSKSLIQFLSSIQKDTSKTFSQYEVHDIIKAYINENQLVHPERKKKVLCDARLHNLFGRKSVSRNKIYDLLEPHFALNEDQSEDESSYDSEEEESFKTRKRQRRISTDGSAYKAKKVTEIPQSCFAKITVKNIKLAYLKKSLVEKLLKNPDTFDGKVLGSFVRIKPDPRNYLQRNTYQLGQVTGVKNVGKEVFLRVLNVKKDVPISMLSDNDLTEEECEDLHKKIKDGILEKITIVELQEKARSLHEDITNHWMEEELVLLQNLIDQANEKGWRRDLFEYLERRELLQRPGERMRLLQEVPKVIAEELEIETLPDSPEEENSGEDELKAMLHKESEALHGLEEKEISSKFAVKADAAGDDGKTESEGLPEIGDSNRDAINEKYAEGLVTSLTATEQEEKEHKLLHDESGSNKEASTVVTGEKNDEDQSVGERRSSTSELINIDDDDDDDDHVNDGDLSNKVVEDSVSCVWHYVDPEGHIQGPFSMSMLEQWHRKNYFNADFKVWKTGQSQEAAILLTDALAQTFSKAKKH